MNICTCATQNDISRNHLISRQHKKLIKGKLLTQNLFIHRAPFLQQHIYIIEPKCHPCHLGLHVLTQLSINNVKKVPKRLKSTLVPQLPTSMKCKWVGKPGQLERSDSHWENRSQLEVFASLPHAVWCYWQEKPSCPGGSWTSGSWIAASALPLSLSQDWGTDSSWNSLTPLLVLTSVGR